MLLFCVLDISSVYMTHKAAFDPGYFNPDSFSSREVSKLTNFIEKETAKINSFHLKVCL